MRVVRGSVREMFRVSWTLVISFIVSYLAFSASHLAFSVSIELTLNGKGNVEVRGKGLCKGNVDIRGKVEDKDLPEQSLRFVLRHYMLSRDVLETCLQILIIGRGSD